MISPPSPATAALETRAVGYQTRAGKRLLADVSVRLEPGEVLAVIGPNGAGKTTLLRLLSGECSPTTGEVLLDERPLASFAGRERSRRIAVLPQQPTLQAPLTGLDVVLLGRSSSPSRGDGAADLAIAHEALASMDVGHLAARLYPSLSGGEKSRVQAARVLAQIWEPAAAVSSSTTTRFVLLDEPTAALDCTHQHRLLARMRELARRQQIGVLAVLHDLQLAGQYADRLLVLKDGRPHACGPTPSVLVPEILTEVFAMDWLIFSHPLQGWPVAIAR